MSAGPSARSVDRVKPPAAIALVSAAVVGIGAVALGLNVAILGASGQTELGTAPTVLIDDGSTETPSPAPTTDEVPSAGTPTTTDEVPSADTPTPTSSDDHGGDDGADNSGSSSRGSGSNGSDDSGSDGHGGQGSDD